jgi:uncharacterized delta-60 repeat protein
MSSEIKHLRQFGKFRLDVQKKVLWHDGEPVDLPLKEIELLCVLTESRGELVTKDELLEKVWSDSFVEESNLSRHIYLLRKTFKDAGDNEELIQTVPRRGYRFVGEVKESENGDLIIEKHTLTQTLIEEIHNSDAEAEQTEFDPPKSAFAKTKNSFLFSDLRVRVLVTSGLVVAIALGGIALLGNKQRATLRGEQEIRSNGGSETGSQAPIAASQPGFASDEKVLTDFGFKAEKAQAVALQPDGKIVAGGWVGDSQATSDFAVARYNPDGSLDPGFHGDGKVVTALGERTDIIYGLALQADGRIVAVGVTFNGPKTRRFAIVRYKPDGALDASFDGDGIVTLNIGTSLMDTAYAVAVQPDGKIVVAGSALMLVAGGTSRVSQNDFGLVRLNADGSLDPGFGDGGKVITDFGYGVDVAYALALEPDGRIVVAGTATNGTDQDFALARYHSDGTLDAGFGRGGKVRTDFFNEDDLISSLTIQSDGRIVVAGYALKATASDFAIARYTDDGSLDNSFNVNGKLTMDINGNDIARAVSLQPDGRIVVAVYANQGAAPEFAIARLSADGKLDETLNASGKSRVRVQKHSEAFGMVLLPDGYAVLVGSAGDGKSSDFALARIRL